jgi:hypothetical protein
VRVSPDTFVTVFFVPILLTLGIGVSMLVGASGRFWDTAQDLSSVPVRTRAICFALSTVAIWTVPLGWLAFGGGHEFDAPRVIRGGAAGPAPESTYPQYKHRGYINDFAGILDSQARSQLDQICKELERKTKTQMAIVTVTSLDGVPIEDFASQLGNSWGVGYKDSNRGILVLISLQERRYRIAVGRGLAWALTDAEADRLGQEMVPMMEKGDYGNALLHLATRVRQELQNN